MEFVPKKVYFEKEIENYSLGKTLMERYKKLGIELIEIDNHNKIPELRELPDSEFVAMKKYLILGIRKTLRLIPNNRSADFIVPFTSSGCSAMCLYCYLVCTYFKNSYLRIFVNRDEMIEQVRKKAAKVGERKVYEIGCNSDMVLENAVSGNLRWAIEEFGKIDNATATFATKFAMVDDLLDAKHNGHTQMRISVNPEHIIRKVEIGTSSLKERIEAANKLFDAGYRVGVNVAPIILMDNWKEMYTEMLHTLKDKLDKKLQKQMFMELIFMTYGYANMTVNKAALPKAVDVFDKGIMKPKGRGKYMYKMDIREDAEEYLKALIGELFPDADISYIV